MRSQGFIPTKAPKPGAVPLRFDRCRRCAGLHRLIVYVNSRPKEKLVEPSAGKAQQVRDQVRVESGDHMVPPQSARYYTDAPSSGRHSSVPGQALLS